MEETISMEDPTTSIAATIRVTMVAVGKGVVETMIEAVVEMTEAVVETMNEAVVEMRTDEEGADAVPAESGVPAGGVGAVLAVAIADGAQVLSESKEPAAVAAVVTRSAARREVLVERRERAPAKPRKALAERGSAQRALAKKHSVLKAPVQRKRALPEKRLVLRASAVGEAERPLLSSKSQLCSIIYTIV